MWRALGEGLRTAGRQLSLAGLLLLANLLAAGLLALPFALVLERDLRSTEAGYRMRDGFDYPWWSRWSDAQSGWAAAFRPDIFGFGFAVRNLDLLLKGRLPFGTAVPEATPTPASAPDPGLDPVVLGLGLAYALVQVFLTGGVLAALRASPGGWTLRGLVHGSGFYFGRLLRVALVALAAQLVLLHAHAPLARWADRQAQEAASESAALAWSLGRHALLLLAMLFVHMLSCYAKLVVVVEERRSALLAWVSALGLCLSNLGRTLGHYLSVAGLGVLLLAAWATLDGLWVATGFRTQLVTLLLAQALMLGRLALRLALYGGQLALHRELRAR